MPLLRFRLVDRTSRRFYVRELSCQLFHSASNVRCTHPFTRARTSVIRPPKLRSGARVALLSPAGPLRGEQDVMRAEENVRAMGWTPVVSAHALARNGYFAGSDDERIADFNTAIADRAIDAIWCIRGGYGAMRLLPHIDFAALAAHPKPLIGFSDITAIHCAVQRECALISYHGPTARTTLDPMTRASLEAALDHRDSCGDAPSARVLREGKARGRIVGGNLALMASLVGTPWAAQLDDAILLLEDINEPVYRIDRMLRQLLLSGSLARCRGILFGECTKCDEEADGGGSRRLDDVLAELADELKIPCLAGIPVGHIDSQWTIPLGAEGSFDTRTRSVSTVAG